MTPKGARQRHTKDMRQEKMKAIVTPVITAHAASIIEPTPSVDTPLMSYASLERVVVSAPGALDFSSNHP